MRQSVDTGYERYATEEFQQNQEITLPKRREVLPVLGLKEEDLQWIEMPIKLNLETYAGLEEVSTVRNLRIVHYIKQKDKQIPSEVLSAARGTILYNSNGKFIIVRRSIPFNYDLIMDKIQAEGDKYAFIVPQGDKTRTIKVSPNSLKIIPYIEGTVIDIMKIDGRVHWFTSRNVLPRGVRHEGKMIYKKARWVDHHEAFTTDFEQIISLVDPALLNKNNELFPKNCITSNKLYRFILLTRDRVRAEAIPVSKRGLAIYLGCFTQFEYADVRDYIKTGEEHTVEYQPRTVSSIPTDMNKAAIVQFNKSMSIAEANAYLAGAHPELGVLSGGGKLVITATIVSAGSRETVVFHVKSSSYAYRERVLAGADNLYKRFISLLDLEYYDFTEKNSIEEYYSDFPSVVLPESKEDVSSLKNQIASETEIVPVSNPDRGVSSTPITHIWYIFLLCTNVSIRERVMRYIERYANDVTHLQKWIFSLNPTEPFKRKSDAPKHKKKADKDKDFILFFRTEILRHELYNKGRGISTVLLILGSKTARSINIARSITGTTMESIKISEPSLEIRPIKTYATDLSND